ERPVHVGLARGDPDFADEQVSYLDAFAVRNHFDHERVRAAGGQGGQAGKEVAVVVAQATGGVVGERDPEKASRGSPTPDDERLVALEHGVILERRGEAECHGGAEWALRVL